MKGDAAKFVDEADRPDFEERAAIDPSKPLRPPRREMFVQNCVAGMSYTQAYLAAGFKSSDNASDFAKHKDVAARIDWIMQEMLAKTIEDMGRARAATIYKSALAMAEAEEVRIMAMRQGKTSSALHAVVLKSRLSGLLKNDGDGVELPMGDMTIEQLERMRVHLGDEERKLEDRLAALESDSGAEGEAPDSAGDAAGVRH